MRLDDYLQHRYFYFSWNLITLTEENLSYYLKAFDIESMDLEINYVCHATKELAFSRIVSVTLFIHL